MPWRTSACSTGSRCRGGRRWRVASDLDATRRPPAGVDRDVDDGGDGQGAFARQKRHEIPQRSEKRLPKLVWRFRSPHHSCSESEMRTSEPKPHQINQLLVSFDSEVRK